MSEKMAEKKSRIEWFPEENYRRINKTLNEWPDWKKEAYNRMFATSDHAQKLTLSNGKTE